MPAGLHTLATATEPSGPQARETDPHRIAQRQKQIDLGKNTVGYQRYRAAVPKCVGGAARCLQQCGAAARRLGLRCGANPALPPTGSLALNLLRGMASPPGSPHVPERTGLSLFHHSR